MESITRVTWTTDSLEVNDYIKTTGYTGKVIGSVQRTFLDQETDQLVDRINKIIILFDPNKRKFSKMTFSSVVYEPATPEQITEFSEEFEQMLRTKTEENVGNKLWGESY